jgi:hypothetical protein
VPATATPADAVWLGVCMLLAVAAIAAAGVACAFRRTPLAYVVAAATIAVLVTAPLVLWASASSSADRFGGGPTMVWTMVLPATRVYALFAAALAAINAAILYVSGAAHSRS